MARRGTAATLAAEVWQSLRREILHGTLAPGVRLKPVEIAQRFGVSTGVVREALTRLAEQRMVVSQHNHGYRVITLSRAMLADLNEFRTTVEELALRLSMERGDLHWESEVIGAHHRLASTERRSPEDPGVTTEAWSSAHRDFHTQLIAACGYPDLLETCTRLYDSAEIYRRWSAPVSAGKRDVDTEHASLMEAVLSRNVARAQRELRQHFARTVEILLASGAAAEDAAPEGN
jgi:DNA-binding GntR family transcriptional regulator